ncbi:expressed unknown protein [Seminavis robusta]|uniref:Uncharacterized protein n=1 Tax=Seminavis robusta TaxID=568900 RepID=A0A9N8DUW9_9STRA|nr:expressed unknown protein [Seminavis robusta]|eukprot:Sro310_g113950.1 n/a (255) ;mRNA; f:3923-4687
MDDRQVHYRILNELSEPIKIQIFNEDPDDLQDEEDEEDDQENDNDDEDLFNGYAPLTREQIPPGQEWTYKKQCACGDCCVGTIKVDTANDRMFLVDANETSSNKKITRQVMTTICSDNETVGEQSCQSLDCDEQQQREEDSEQQRPLVVNLTLEVKVDDSPKIDKEDPLIVNLILKAVPASATSTEKEISRDCLSPTSVNGMLQRLQDIETMIAIGHEVPDSLDEQISERSKLSQFSERSKLSSLSERSKLSHV